MTVNIYDVSNYFLSLAQQEKVRLTNLRMQKLLYYSQGFHLALHDKPLFDDEVEAWDFGPVLPRIYFSYQNLVEQSLKAFNAQEKDILSSAIVKLMRAVFHQYGSYEVWSLLDKKYTETPWSDAYQSECKAVIPLASLKKHFKHRIKAIKNRTVEDHLEESFKQYGELYDLLAR